MKSRKPGATSNLLGSMSVQTSPVLRQKENIGESSHVYGNVESVAS